MSAAMDVRFDGGLRTSGEALGAWMPRPVAADGAIPRSLVHGVDLVGASRPRAVRALLHHRMARLQEQLVRDAAVRRVLVVARVADGLDLDRACAGFDAAAASVHRRVETLRGRPLGLAVVVVPASAPAAHVCRCITDGVHVVPDGAAAVTWDDAAGWGIRAAVALQSL